MLQQRLESSSLIWWKFSRFFVKLSALCVNNELQLTRNKRLYWRVHLQLLWNRESTWWSSMLSKLVKEQFWLEILDKTNVTKWMYTAKITIPQRWFNRKRIRVMFAARDQLVVEASMNRGKSDELKEYYKKKSS